MFFLYLKNFFFLFNSFLFLFLLPFLFSCCRNLLELPFIAELFSLWQSLFIWQNLTSEQMKEKSAIKIYKIFSDHLASVTLFPSKLISEPILVSPLEFKELKFHEVARSTLPINRLASYVGQHSLVCMSLVRQSRPPDMGAGKLSICVMRLRSTFLWSQGEVPQTGLGLWPRTWSTPF